MSEKTERIIYRVQDRDGRGPWKPGFSHVWVSDRPDEEFELLKPIQVDFPDLRVRSAYHVGVGCVSLEQLRRWFKREEFYILRKHGYRCVKMTVKRIVAESDIQCVFERSLALKRGCKTVRLYP